MLKELIIRALMIAIALWTIDYFLIQVSFADLTALLVTAGVLAIINTFIRPIVMLLTMPITVLTLGLFALVVNALLVMLVDYLITGFSLDGFLFALITALLIGLITVILSILIGKK